jgi:hypothetical protein
MWPFNKNNVKEEKNAEAVDVQPAAISAEEQLRIDTRMVEYLKTKGFDVSPSGTPKLGVIGTVTKVSTDTFHVGRGCVRKMTGTVSDKLNELKTLGT